MLASIYEIFMDFKKIYSKMRQIAFQFFHYSNGTTILHNFNKNIIVLCNKIKKFHHYYHDIGNLNL